MALRELLLDLLGAEIQEQPVTVGGRTQKLRFRQVSDAEGREIFAPGAAGEAADARGRRVMSKLVALSLLGPDDKPCSTPEEVAALSGGALLALYEAAAKTNNIRTASDADVSRETDPSTEAGAAPKH